MTFVINDVMLMLMVVVCGFGIGGGVGGSIYHGVCENVLFSFRYTIDDRYVYF